MKLCPSVPTSVAQLFFHLSHFLTVTTEDSLPGDGWHACLSDTQQVSLYLQAHKIMHLYADK